ncbi:hypothetical protein A4X13_0g7785 [Tilletia indica]|uniref:Uncharacterized protein n=1 Tax=Tilletia indica TaxID=43049 RepID=A0A177T489_9BASI|nr:hypothetical protein A4X13_0g7785 [Tilletia indica]
MLATGREASGSSSRASGSSDGLGHGPTSSSSSKTKSKSSVNIPSRPVSPALSAYDASAPSQLMPLPPTPPPTTPGAESTAPSVSHHRPAADQPPRRKKQKTHRHDDPPLFIPPIITNPAQFASASTHTSAIPAACQTQLAAQQLQIRHAHDELRVDMATLTLQRKELKHAREILNEKIATITHRMETRRQHQQAENLPMRTAKLIMPQGTKKPVVKSDRIAQICFNRERTHPSADSLNGLALLNRSKPSPAASTSTSNLSHPDDLLVHEALQRYLYPANLDRSNSLHPRPKPRIRNPQPKKSASSQADANAQHSSSKEVCRPHTESNSHAPGALASITEVSEVPSSAYEPVLIPPHAGPPSLPSGTEPSTTNQTNSQADAGTEDRWHSFIEELLAAAQAAPAPSTQDQSTTSSSTAAQHASILSLVSSGSAAPVPSSAVVLQDDIVAPSAHHTHSDAISNVPFSDAAWDIFASAAAIGNVSSSHGGEVDISQAFMHGLVTSQPANGQEQQQGQHGNALLSASGTGFPDPHVLGGDDDGGGEHHQDHLGESHHHAICGSDEAEAEAGMLLLRASGGRGTGRGGAADTGMEAELSPSKRRVEDIDMNLDFDTLMERLAG